MNESKDGNGPRTPRTAPDRSATSDFTERERLARERVAQERLAEMLSELGAAIDERKEVRLVYGSDLTLRLVLPHAVGVGASGNPLLLAWQVGGGSRTTPTGWKHFALGKVRGFEVSDTTFRGVAPGYDPENTVLAKVWKAL